MAFDINIKDCKHTPSFITAGLDGDTGKEGLRGTSLYFTNYDLSNDYYKDIIIRKLTNNIMLSSDADVKKENGSYDIECIGILKDENIVNDFKDNIINVTINVSYEELTIGTESMRSFNTANENINGKSYCLRIKPHIYTTTDTGYDYFLRIYLYNKKYIHGGEYTLDDDFIVNEYKTDYYGLPVTENYIEFYKKTEFKLCDVHNTETNKTTYNQSYDIIIPEMTMDLLHPSNNNISINYEKIGKSHNNYNFIEGDDRYECVNKYSDDRNLNNGYIDNVPLSYNQDVFQYEVNKNLINFRSGESCYFSGFFNKNLVCANEVNRTETTKQDVCDHMFSFLTSDKNKIEIVCVNRETRRIEIIDTKDSNIKCKFIITNEQTI